MAKVASLCQNFGWGWDWGWYGGALFFVLLIAEENKHPYILTVQWEMYSGEGPAIIQKGKEYLVSIHDS